MSPAECAMSAAQVAVARRYRLSAVTLALLPDWLVRRLAFKLIAREA